MPEQEDSNPSGSPSEEAGAAGAGPPEAQPDLIPTIVEQPFTAEQVQQASVAVAAARAVPPEAKSALIATIVRELDTAEQKQQAAVAAAGAVPPEAKPGLIATIVGQLASTQRLQAMTAAVATLSPEAKSALIATVTGELDTAEQKQQALAAAEAVMDALATEQDRVTTEAGEVVPADSLESAEIVRLIVKVLGADCRQLREIAIRRRMTVTDALRQCITAQSWIDQQKHSNSSFIVEDSRGNRRRVVFP